MGNFMNIRKEMFMKGILSVLVKPLAARLGTMAAGGIAGSMVVDPAIASSLGAWVSAGVFLAADLVASYFNSKSQEVR
jgi:hypothetical protein